MICHFYSIKWRRFTSLCLFFQRSLVPPYQFPCLRPPFNSHHMHTSTCFNSRAHLIVIGSSAALLRASVPAESPFHLSFGVIQCVLLQTGFTKRSANPFFKRTTPTDVSLTIFPAKAKKQTWNSDFFALHSFHVVRFSPSHLFWVRHPEKAHKIL